MIIKAAKVANSLKFQDCFKLRLECLCISRVHCEACCDKRFLESSSFKELLKHVYNVNVCEHWLTNAFAHVSWKLSAYGKLNAVNILHQLYTRF